MLYFVVYVLVLPIRSNASIIIVFTLGRIFLLVGLRYTDQNFKVRRSG